MFYIEKKDWNKVISYAQAAWDEHRSEIGGMMVVVQDKDDDWQIQDPVILKQRISSGNTHLDKEELAKYYTKAAKKYKDNIFRFCWWHSHHTMQAFWSGTDTSTIDEFSDGDFSFALVVNLKEEYKFRVSVWKPMEVHEDVDLEILSADKAVKQSIINEVNKLCEKESYGYNKLKSNNINRLAVDNQVTLWERNEDIPDDKEYIQLATAIEQLNDRLIKGDIIYIDYYNRLSDINQQLEAANSDYKVRIVGQLEQEQLLYLNASDFIESEEDEDVKSWNASFGVGGPTC